MTLLEIKFSQSQRDFPALLENSDHRLILALQKHEPHKLASTHYYVLMNELDTSTHTLLPKLVEK